MGNNDNKIKISYDSKNLTITTMSIMMTITMTITKKRASITEIMTKELMIIL